MTTTVPVWEALTRWIKKEGGDVHHSLELRMIGNCEKSSINRGIFASRPILSGESLIKLPSRLAIDGRDFPTSWKAASNDDFVEGNANTQRNASPWLRCLAAYMKAQSNPGDNPYLASLPSQYETISQWTEEQLDQYLAGTSTQAGTTVDWKFNKSLLQERFRQQVRPYLEQHCPDIFSQNSCSANKTIADGLDDSSFEEKFDNFLIACQVLATRCFHLMVEGGPEEASCISNNNSYSTTQEQLYTGPFLLPVIDLVNHDSSEKKCTTLQRLQDYFVMKAERDISANEEIFHSYGDDLTASQFLQTFGFVPLSSMQRCVSRRRQDEERGLRLLAEATTPALFTKTEILESCWSVIDSQLPQQLAASMQEGGFEDEVWEVSVDRSRKTEFISQDLVVTLDNPLTDELVTLACLPFLPVCAYQEAARTLLDPSILQDYYLGNLVCTSILKAAQRKKLCYKPIRFEGVERNDDELLRELLSRTTVNGNSSVIRLMYALTIRIEEKACIESLRKEIIRTLASLDDTTNEYDDGNSCDEEESSAKRQRER